MFKPYKIIEETETSVTYEYNSLYSWVLIIILVILLIGSFAKILLVQFIAMGCFFIYFAAKLSLGKATTKTVKSALKTSSVEISGGQYSLSNPLRIKVPKKS